MYLKDERLFIGEGIDCLKRTNKARKNRLNRSNDDEDFCGLCDKLNSQVNRLLATASVDICDGCIHLLQEVITENE